jgi:hypothetical protein
MEQMTDVIVGMDAVNLIDVSIRNRQHQRQSLWEKIVVLDGEIEGLREAIRLVQKLPGYNVALNRDERTA